MNHGIRLARVDEIERVRELEDLAGERYAEAGLPPDLEGLPLPVVVQAQADELLWVVTHHDEPIGFALCWLRPRALHLRELDVHPAWMGRGLGRKLVEHAVLEAKRRGLSDVTLTTFRDVAWNAPLYRHWGFVEVELARLPQWLRDIREEEDAGELRNWPRVAMIRRLEA